MQKIASENQICEGAACAHLSRRGFLLGSAASVITAPAVVRPVALLASPEIAMTAVPVVIGSGGFIVPEEFIAQLLKIATVELITSDGRVVALRGEEALAQFGRSLDRIINEPVGKRLPTWSSD